MPRPSLFAFCVCVGVLLRSGLDGQSTAVGADPDLWVLGDLPALEAVPEMTWLDSDCPIRSLTYRNEPFNGMPTDVFAFYATPGSVSGNAKPDKDLPAVVLIHGGGGTAFAEWAWLWAKRGYAAIAMDLSGRRPSAPEFDPQTRELNVVRNHRDIIRTRLPHGGPEADHVSKFTNTGGDLSDDWQIHAVAAVIRAHSLIRSFPEIDAERTAVTGISWGGYLTCLTASIDSRFKAAVPVYGCGFLYDGESVQRSLIDALPEAQRADWIRRYDPSAWLPQCRVPILFVNGTNDKHYPLVSYDRCYDLVPGPKAIRIEVNMRHSHPAGWDPQEIGLFIDQKLRGGDPLPALGTPQIEDGVASATVDSKLPLKLAQVHFTTDDGPLIDRKWQSMDATLKSGRVTGQVPGNATIWLLSVTDSRGAMVSSEIIIAD